MKRTRRTSRTDTVMSGQAGEQPRRHACVVCGERKHDEEFPITAEGERLLVTCNDCAGQTVTRRRRNAPPEEQQNNVGRLAVPNPVLRHGLRQGLQRAILDIEVADLAPPPAPALTPRKRKRTREDYPIQRKKSRKSEVRAPPKPRVATCRICIDEKPVAEFPKPAPKPKAGVPWYNWEKGDVPESCVGHLSVNKLNLDGGVCKSCIGASINASIDLKGAEKVGCLHEGCNAVWDTTDYVARYLSNEEFTAFSEKLFDTWTKVNKQLKQCINEECGATALMETHAAGYPHLECSSCKVRMCATCSVPWHQGQTCQQYRWAHVSDTKSKDELKALKMLQKQGAKRCPHCSLAVVKDGGCPSMWCTHCNRAFWWDSAEKITAAPPKTLATRAQKKRGPEMPPPPGYVTVECEIERLERMRVAAEAVAEGAAAMAAMAATGS